MKNETVFLTSTGCFIVQTETNLIAAHLSSNGYELVDTIDKAQSIIITTCAVTADTASVTHAKILECIAKRTGSHVPIYVVGCYTRVEREKMGQLLSESNIFAISGHEELKKIFRGSLPSEPPCYNNFFSHPFAEQRLVSLADKAPFKFRLAKRGLGLLDRAFHTDLEFRYLFRNGHLYQPEVQRAIWPVLAAKGCIYKCSYCAVRIGRGKYTSKPPKDVLEEIKKGVDLGYDKVLLIGDELGTYGVDLRDGTTLRSLLTTIVSEDIPVKLGFWYLDSFRIKEAADILEELAYQRKIFFLGITIQSGSQRILNLMNRHYSVSDTMEIVRRLRKFPEIMIATQFMVGFPTETEDDYCQTLTQVAKGYFDNVEVYCFSPRPGTRAAEMEDDVAAEIKERRAKDLRELAAKHSRRLFLNYAYHGIKSALLSHGNSRNSLRRQ